MAIETSVDLLGSIAWLAVADNSLLDVAKFLTDKGFHLFFLDL
jgi:hypothetical protein